MAKKDEVVIKKAKQEPGEVITDIIEVFFMENGQEFIKKTFMNKDILIKEEISPVK